MAKKKMKSADLEFDIEPDFGTVTVTSPGRGNPTDVRTYHAPKKVTFPLAQKAEKVRPFARGGVESRDGHVPTTADCGDVHVAFDAVRPNPDVDTTNQWNSVGL